MDRRQTTIAAEHGYWTLVPYDEGLHCGYLLYADFGDEGQRCDLGWYIGTITRMGVDMRGDAVYRVRANKAATVVMDRYPLHRAMAVLFKSWTEGEAVTRGADIVRWARSFRVALGETRLFEATA